jgi:hypothetical protein
MVGDDEGPIPRSAKGSDGRTDKTAPGTSVEQNEAERRVNPAGTGKRGLRLETDLKTTRQDRLQSTIRVRARQEAQAGEKTQQKPR